MGNRELKFYIATDDPKQRFRIFCSETYSLSELELLYLIKLCLVTKRNKKIGTKLKNVYLKLYNNSNEAIDTLKSIGLKIQNEKPTTSTAKKE